MSHPDASPEAGDLDPFLPGTWVHRIWSAMRGNYGAEFDRLWARPAHLEAARTLAVARQGAVCIIDHLELDPEGDAALPAGAVVQAAS